MLTDTNCNFEFLIKENQMKMLQLCFNEHTAQ